MIENVTDLPPGTLGFRATGKITSDEYRQMIEPIYAAAPHCDLPAVWGLTRMSWGTDWYWDIDGLMPGPSSWMGPVKEALR